MRVGVVARQSPTASVAALLVVLLGGCAGYSCDTQATFGLPQVVAGRCLEDLNARGSTANHSAGVAYCNEFTARFIDAFRFKNVTSVADFEGIVGFAPPTTARNRALFWSGTGPGPLGDVVHRLSAIDPAFSTLEDTQLGGIANSIGFCGDPTSPDGILHNGTCCSTFPFWQLASQRFAESVRGDFTLLLHGTAERKAYRRTSVFGEFELPALSPANTRNAHILVVKNTAAGEVCGGGSLVDLVSDLRARLGTRHLITCIDDPPVVEYLLCADTPTSAQCDFVKRHQSSGGSDVELSPGELMGIVLASFAAGLLVMAVVSRVRGLLACWALKRRADSAPLVTSSES